jgi:hypothetical protein
MKTDRNVVNDQMNWADYCDALRSEHYAGALTRFEGRNDVRKVLKKASVEQDRDVAAATVAQEKSIGARE